MMKIGKNLLVLTFIAVGWAHNSYGQFYQSSSFVPPTYGSGIPSANPGCGYGSQPAPALADDYEMDIRAAKEELRDAMYERSDNAAAYSEARREYEGKKRDLGRVLVGISVDKFVSLAQTCDQIYQKECAEVQGIPGPCDQKIKEAFPDSGNQLRCIRAKNDSKADSGSAGLGAQFLCIDKQGGMAGSDSPAIDVKSENLAACKTAARGLLEAYNKFKAAETAKSEEGDKVKRARSNLRSEQRRIQREMREDAQLRKELGDLGDDTDAGSAGVRGNTCSVCGGSRGMVVQRDHTGDYIGLGLGVGNILMNFFANQLNAKRNAQLGYPTGPNPYASLFPLMGGIPGGMVAGSGTFGYPFGYGGIYGATMGGMGAGGFGCSPGIGGAMGYPNYPLGFPNAGGMYVPGMSPWGMNGPYGALGLNMGLNPYASMMMNPAAMMMGPFAGGMGSPYGYPGMFPYGPGLGGFGGMGGFPGGMGGFPGGMPGMGGFGGFGGMGGFPGAGGMGGMDMSMLNYQMQMMQQQMAAMQDYSRKYQLYYSTMMQASQLQQQAMQIMSSGGGSMYGGGMGGFGGAMAPGLVGGFWGAPPSLGISMGGGINFGLGGAGGMPPMAPNYLAPAAPLMGPPGTTR